MVAALCEGAFNMGSPLGECMSGVLLGNDMASFKREGEAVCEDGEPVCQPLMAMLREGCEELGEWHAKELLITGGNKVRKE